MLKSLLYYVFKVIIWFSSKLSDKNLYRCSNIIKVVLYNLLGYRKQVVIKNLRMSFPVKSAAEIALLAEKYYQHLSDLIMETLASYSWSREKLATHFKFTNLGVLQPYLEQKKRMVGVSAHFGNFEIGAILIPSQLKVPGYAIYRPLANPKLEQWMYKKRTRSGLTIVPSKELRPMIEKMSSPGILFLLADQNPSIIQKAYWVNFLNRDTAFVHGPANVAKEHNMPILFFDSKRVKRGYYESEISVLVDDPTKYTHQQITEMFAKKLEHILQERPDDWLWSHKRWKWAKINEEIVRI
ncbi:MAG: lysophospholipid acyltransferase family protein [Saprospiraceae bacterium]|nr:lysophospholipid acyltransferase family protein [Saprospiraceae bacterium]MBK8281577.1 lysophospholipid acyltransferase family protein [Saprospiraceae bacterium]MBK8514123.1 lysophospholipid acyltransferase family protein [Saprospiraceae bacterium]MBK9929469.1 lysophospholipid acyltransferase family protein [Saprospiraceae bacterium]